VAGSITSLHERATYPVMHARFGNTTRAWQQINALLDTEEALAYAPTAVLRLRRVRDRRAALRAQSREPKGTSTSATHPRGPRSG